MLRRELLEAITSVATAGGIDSCVGGASGRSGGPRRRFQMPGTAPPTNEVALPVDAIGTTYVRYERLREDELFHEERIFRSEALRERYGDPLFRIESREIPAGLVPPEARGQDVYETKVADRRIVGRPDEHANAERLILGNATLQRDDVVPDDLYENTEEEMPLFYYSGEAGDAPSDESEYDKAERASPMNLAWEGLDPDEVKTFMKRGTYGRNWDSRFADSILFPSEAKHTYYDGDPVGVANEITDCAEGQCFSTQYHIRTYDVDRADGRPATVGQVHRDPCDHNQIYRRSTKYIGAISECARNRLEPILADLAQNSFKTEQSMAFVDQWWTEEAPDDLNDPATWPVVKEEEERPTVLCNEKFTYGWDPEFESGLLEVDYNPGNSDSPAKEFNDSEPPDDVEVLEYHGKILYIAPDGSVPNPPPEPS